MKSLNPDNVKVGDVVKYQGQISPESGIVRRMATVEQVPGGSPAEFPFLPNSDKFFVRVPEGWTVACDAAALRWNGQYETAWPYLDSKQLELLAPPVSLRNA